MYSFTEWLQKKHNIVIEDLQDKGDGNPPRREPAETPEQAKEKLKQELIQKRARTKGDSGRSYSRFRR